VIYVPTLEIDAHRDPAIARDLAERMASVRFINKPPQERCPRTSLGRGVNERPIRSAGFVEEFLDERTTLEQVLATVLFTDVVGSTDPFPWAT